MPPKRKAPTPSAALPAVPAPLTTEYRTFLNNYISGKGKNKPYLSRPIVRGWQDADVTTPKGRIENEIAKKFNLTNSFGIGEVPTFAAAG